MEFQDAELHFALIQPPLYAQAVLEIFAHFIGFRNLETTGQTKPSHNTMASSSNPYEHYNSPEVEDDDLIDPDDGTLSRTSKSTHLTQPFNTILIIPSKPRRPRRSPPTPQRQFLPPTSHRQHSNRLRLCPPQRILPHLPHPRRRPTGAHKHNR